MRCQVCDKLLQDTEAKSKDPNGNFRDTCSKCTGIVWNSVIEFDQSLNNHWVDTLEENDYTHGLSSDKIAT